VTDTVRADVLRKMQEAMKVPAGMQALKFLLNGLGGVPYVGGLFSGGAALWSEKEQAALNSLFANWAALNDAQLKLLSDAVATLTAGPTPASFAVLLGEVFGNEIAEELLTKAPAHIRVVLNSLTVGDLKPFVKLGWAQLTSTGATCSMGAGNRVGNHFEELKNPHGIGSGFVLQVEKV